MTIALSLSLWASLEDLDNHKEKPLTCDLELDIYCNQQKKMIATKMEIKMKKPNDIWSSLEDHLNHKMETLSCKLELNIVVR